MTTEKNTFGGLIYLSDFETEYRGKTKTTGSNIASRILSDWRFDKQCLQNIEQRTFQNNHKLSQEE